jgi:hypothetical protein
MITTDRVIAGQNSGKSDHSKEISPKQRQAKQKGATEKIAPLQLRVTSAIYFGGCCPEGLPFWF